MEDEKKPKRPRIGANPTPAASAENGEARYEKVNYSGEHHSYSPGDRQQRPYQPRPYGQQRPQYGQQRPQYGQQRNYNNGYQRPQAPRAEGDSENSYRQQRPQYGQQRQNSYGQQRPQYGQQRQQGYKPRPYGQQRPQYGQQSRPGQNQGGYKRPQPNRFQQRPGKQFIPRPKQIDYVIDDIDPNEPIRLNKFMANAGVCSRREADEHITAGLVKVNGEVVTELGTKITGSDIVEYDGKTVVPERKCYVLLNKPKDCVTTSDDPNGRTTVLDLVKNACKERIYPVGRLDRNTTGVLLLTNDGDLASKLTHPKYVKKKIYHVWTDKDIEEDDMQRIADGIELEDGEIHADAISYVNDSDRNQAGIEIHSGRNRIVRRIFEALGYRVTKLDRVYFAGLTKKNLPRGRWRYLTQEEVDYLRQGTFE